MGNHVFYGSPVFFLRFSEVEQRLIMWVRVRLDYISRSVQVFLKVDDTAVENCLLV